MSSFNITGLDAAALQRYFKDIYGMEIDKSLAIELLVELVRLIDLTYQPITKDQVQSLPKNENEDSKDEQEESKV